MAASLTPALVANIYTDSAAFAGGVRQGDSIQEINRKPVLNAPDAMAATKNPTSQRTLLRVWSRGGSHKGGARRVCIAGSFQNWRPDGLDMI